MTRAPLPQTVVGAALLLALLTLSGCRSCDPLAALPQPSAILRHGLDEAPPLERLEIALAPVAPGARSLVSIAVDNAGAADLTVSNVRLAAADGCPSLSGAFSLALSAAAPFVVQRERRAPVGVDVTFAPVDGAPACAVLVVDSDDPLHPTLTALITGQGDAGALCADRALVDFGDVVVGASRTEGVTLTSCGTRPVAVTGLTFNAQFPAPFTLAPLALPVMVPVGGTMTLTTTFAPTEPRRFDPAAGTSGVIMLGTDVAGASYRIDLAGNGVVPPACRLAAAPAVVNMGTVAAGRWSTQSVLLRNLGELACTLSSTRLSGSPSFALANAPLDGAVLAPLDDIALDVTFAPPSAAGPENAQLDVVVAELAGGAVSVPIEGNSIEPQPCMLEAQPASLSFGFAPTGHTTTRTFTLSNVGTASCRLTDLALTSGAPAFSLQQSPIPVIGTPIPVGSSFDVVVAFRPDAAGAVAGGVRATYRQGGFGNPAQTLDVPVSGSGLSPCIAVAPLDIDLGAVAPGSTASAAVTITSTCAVDLEVRGLAFAAGSDGALSVDDGAALPLPLTLAPGAQSIVTVRASPSSPGALFGVLEVLSDDADDPVVPVRVRANSGQCSAQLACTPAGGAVDFGAVDVGTSLSRPVACVNVSNAAVTLSPSTSPASAPFAIVNAPSSLAPGETGVIDVVFTPAGSGLGAPVSATLTLGASTCAPLTLTGRGVDDAPPCPTSTTFDAVVKWRWTGAHSFATPLVIRTHDTDGDGAVGVADVPRVIAVTFDAGDAPDPNGADANAPVPGVVRAFDGADGTLLWTSSESAPVNAAVTPATGDVDGSGRVLVVTAAYVELPGQPEIPGGPLYFGRYARGSLLAFDGADGSLVWRSDEWTRRFEDVEDAGAPALGDVDGDGKLEIAYGDHLYDHRGRLLWRGGHGIGSAGRGAMSVLVDVDGFPGLELVAGRTVYRGHNGAVLWDRDDLALYGEDGLPSVGDVDGDGDVEVLMRSASLWLMDGRTGAPLADPLQPPIGASTGDTCDDSELVFPETCQPPPAPASLIDVDGDGALEIVQPNKDVLLAWRYDSDGPFDYVELLRLPAADASGASGVAGFDFVGDGASEIVSVDEEWVSAWTGDGDVLYEAQHASITAMETASIADVDGDGHADIVVVENDHVIGSGRGVTVLGSAGNTWPSARGIWNQHAFLDGIVDELGRPARNVSTGFRATASRCD